MTWLQFTLWVLLAYVAYYGAVISVDLLKKRGRADTPEDTTLHFEDEVTVVRPQPEAAAPAVSAIVSSGGVNLQQLFALCREEAVDYRKAVSY